MTLLPPPLRDWDDAFANMAHIPGAEVLPATWQEDAAAYRKSGVRVDEIAYGIAPREKFDLIWPETTPKGLAVFVHGGFWMRLDKSHWTHFAEGARARGWVVCMPSYTLAPDARIRDMTLQIGAAIAKAADMVSGPVCLSGHSAGGHLVSRMVCHDTPLAATVLARIDCTTSISGLHDLRPLLHTQMNETLGLTLVEARSESAALRLPSGHPKVTAWVGGDERPEFIRQSELLALMWSGFDAAVRLHIDAGHHHFSVIEGLRDAESAITKAFVGDTE